MGTTEFGSLCCPAGTGCSKENLAGELVDLCRTSPVESDIPCHDDLDRKDRDYTALFMSIYEKNTHLEGKGSTTAVPLLPDPEKAEFLKELGEFRNLFDTDNPLDLKNSDPFLNTATVRDCGVRFFGRDVGGDVPGNVMYGMIGFLFWNGRYEEKGLDTSLFLAAAAGAAQAEMDRVETVAQLLQEDEEKWKEMARGDDACDTWALNHGSDAVESYGSGITEAELTSFLSQAGKYLHDPSMQVCEDSTEDTTTTHPY